MLHTYTYLFPPRITRIANIFSFFQVGKFRSKEDKQDAELRQLLGKEHSPENDVSNNLQCGSLPWRRQRKDNGNYVITRIYFTLPVGFFF